MELNKQQEKKDRVFSGIQPTGDMHLGNYLGAVKNWVNSQDVYENIYCIVNSHAITTYIDPKILKDKTYNLFAMLIACGIDLSKSKLFVQSTVDYHPALTWILDCNISIGDMNRMTQFKDKSAKNPKNVNVGLFNYPALMAADILLYDADLVPVGIDQMQHLELTRSVATRFNEKFGHCFKIPKALIPPIGAKIMSLDNPEIKMSKSNKSSNGTIYMLDTKDEIMKKIKKATTDSLNVLEFDDSRIGLYNLLIIYECLSNKNRNEILSSFNNYSSLKEGLGELIYSTLKPIQDKYYELINNKNFLKEMNECQEYVNEIAKKTYEKVKKMIGLI